MRRSLIAAMLLAGACVGADAGEWDRFVLRVAEVGAIEDVCPGSYANMGTIVDEERVIDPSGLHDLMAEVRPLHESLVASLRSNPNLTAICAASVALYGPQGAYARGFLNAKGGGERITIRHLAEVRVFSDRCGRTSIMSDRLAVALTDARIAARDVEPGGPRYAELVRENGEARRYVRRGVDDPAKQRAFACALAIRGYGPDGIEFAGLVVDDGGAAFLEKVARALAFSRRCFDLWIDHDQLTYFAGEAGIEGHVFAQAEAVLQQNGARIFSGLPAPYCERGQAEFAQGGSVLPGLLFWKGG